MWPTLLGSHVTITAWFTCDRHYLVHMWPSAIIVHSLPFTPLNTHIDSRHVCGRYSLLPRYSSQGNVWHGAGSNWFVTTNGLWLLTVCTKSSLHTISKNLLHVTIFHFHVALYLNMHFLIWQCWLDMESRKELNRSIYAKDTLECVIMSGISRI